MQLSLLVNFFNWFFTNEIHAKRVKYVKFHYTAVSMSVKTAFQSAL